MSKDKPGKIKVSVELPGGRQFKIGVPLSGVGKVDAGKIVQTVADAVTGLVGKRES